MRILVALSLLGGLLVAQDAKARRPETIDYKKPDRYAKIPKSAGKAAGIRAIAKSLKHKNAEQTLRRIHAYVAAGIPDVPFDGWGPDHRDFDELRLGFDHRGCASHAMLFCNLARACGLPAVYVKSSRHQWIAKYVATGETGNFSGHVFLEVFLDGKWKLLDAQGMRIWDTYDPSDLELPGGLLASEKGWDHYAMVHSTRRDLYIAEAKRRWRGFDVSKLRKNQAPGRSLLPPVFAVTLSGEWRALAARVAGLRSFDLGYWEKTIPRVRGNILIVTSMGGRVEVPPREVGDWLPVTLTQLKKDSIAGKSSVRTRKLEDGTLVVLLAAPGRSELMTLIWSTNFVKIRSEFGNKK